jgi:altronate hydrolase
MSRRSISSVRLHPDDHVAILLSDAAEGDLVDGVPATGAIPSGHKIALRQIAKGEAVLKYGQVIGSALEDIVAGAHVHVHNLAMSDAPRASASKKAPESRSNLDGGATFKGFVRQSGRVGTRNYIGVLTSVNCSATVARRVADWFTAERMAGFPGVDGVVAFTHATGCGTPATGEGIDNLNRTLAGFVGHPNFGGVLVIGLGCEVNQIDRLFAEYGIQAGSTIRTMTIQEAGGTTRAIEHGIGVVKELCSTANDYQRETVPASHLVVGLQCGGSDGWSGVTANPSLGAAADRVVANGGVAILSETPEIYGAEHLLISRAESASVAQSLRDRIAWWEDYVARNGAELNNNPSPGNIKGGLTTILEKSLGAVAKSGSSPLREVYRYAEPIRTRGFVFMDSPGYDPCSATGQMASGANLIAFTTGRGSVFGSKPAPCLKLASNARLATHMDEDMDVDCSPVLGGKSVDAMGEEIFSKMLAIASGEPTKSEALGLGDHEFVPWQIGAFM